MPIKASRSVEYQGLRIEIVALDRFKNWPPRSPSANHKAARRPAIRLGQSGIPRDVEPGSEIAVVRLRTINDDSPGARFDRIVLYDSDGNEYQSTLRSFGIGIRGEKVFPPHGAIEYEFPFIVRKGRNITAVQLRNGEETITFDINWLNVENAVAH